MSRKCHIYQVRNTRTGRLYVGSTVNPTARWGLHKSNLRYGYHNSADFLEDWALYGEDAFVFEILETTTVDLRGEVEQRWMNEKVAEAGAWGLYNKSTRVVSPSNYGPRSAMYRNPDLPPPVQLWKADPEANREHLLRVAREKRR